jgi:hypothetical protein
MIDRSMLEMMSQALLARRAACNRYGVRVLDEDRDPMWEGSLGELLLANEDGLAPDEISRLRELGVGQATSIGGGAAPLFTVVRTS